MFRLGTFGGLSLAGQDGAPVATQRLRLALLALLVHAGERGLSRDKLLGFLWADSSPDSARHKLEQALYMLRRQLGEATFIGADPLRLNPEVLAADLTDFEHALRRGDLSAVVSLHRGPFLDGFYLNGAEEFERWVESERDRLAERYRWALEQLASESDARGDPVTAVAWWRKLAAADPLSSRATVGLMRALVAAGDRPSALRQALIYDHLVREELQSEPDPALHSLVEELRAASPTPIRQIQSPMGRSDRPLEGPVGDSIPSGLTQEMPAEPEPGPRPAPGLEPTVSPGRRQSRLLTIALPTVAAVGLFLALALRHRPAAPATAGTSGTHRIVIVPFQVATPDSSLTYLREGMVDLLAAKLTGEVGPVAVDPRTTLSAWRRATASEGADNAAAEVRLAHAVGAGQILRGEVVQAGGDLVLDGTVLSADGQHVFARASVSGPTDSLLGLVDRLAASLLALQAGEGARHLALLTSTSLPALHAYLDGRAAYRRGESGVAMTDYDRALELDSTFALAALELVVASGWVFTLPADSLIRMPLGSGGQVGQVMRYQLQWIRAMDVAWRYRQRLGRRDFATLMAVRGPRYPEGTAARDLLDTWWQLAQNAPDQADAWYFVGYILLYQGPAMGLPDAREQASAAFQRAQALDSEFAPPVAGLLELAAQRADSSEVRRLGIEYLSRDSAGPTADYVRWHVAAVTRDAARLQAIRARFDSFDLETLDRIQWTAQVEGIDLEDADRAMATMIRRWPNDSGYVLFYANMLALNRGRPREALRIMEELRKLGWGNYDWLRMMYGQLWDSNREAAAQSARRLETKTAAPLPDLVTYWGLVQWWLASGDTARATKDCELLQSDAVAQDPGAKRTQIPIQASLLIASIRRQPNLPDLLARADSITAGGCCNNLRWANLFVARAHERAGDLAGALAAVRRERWYYPPEYLSVSLREEGRLAALTGDTAGAVAAYRHYLALRSDPEPELRPQAERIRRELALLEHGR
jgi:DNA-binding SARP family transcriptional activator